MSSDGPLLFKIATGLYSLSLVCAFFFNRRPTLLFLFLLPALLVNAVAVALRFWTAWPMLPMYAGPLALPLCMGMVIAFSGYSSPSQARTLRGVLILTVIIALAGVLFPKDYYIPFIKSQTVWAHLFFWFGVAGRMCFFVAAAWAMAGLISGNGVSETGRGGDGGKLTSGERGRRTTDDGRDGFSVFHPSPLVTRPSGPLPLSASLSPRVSPSSRSMQWIAWGFAFWTLSMFTGELWSYLGWGTPVVWDDPAITTTMATWFFYICLMHLHLTGSWTVRNRAVYTAVGALVVLVLNCVPELGPFRWPI